jgi:hypothetical protein
MRQLNLETSRFRIHWLRLLRRACDPSNLPSPKPGTMPSHKSSDKLPNTKPERNPYELSSLSTKAVGSTRWSSRDFVLAAGLCILQPSTGRVVLVSIGDQEPEKAQWFLPRGRKDIGESLEKTALREGYEVRPLPTTPYYKGKLRDSKYGRRAGIEQRSCLFSRPTVNRSVQSTRRGSKTRIDLVKAITKNTCVLESRSSSKPCLNPPDLHEAAVGSTHNAG